MKKIGDTINCTQYTNERGRLANIVRNSNNGHFHKVIVKDESGNIKVLATRCSYSTAVQMCEEFLK